jgi:hypothetical protein
MKKKPLIEQLTDEELEAEVERRKLLARKAPIRIVTPDFSTLITTVDEFITGLEEDVENYREDDDTEHYIYEAAVEALYGKEIWGWLNKIAEEAENG